MTKAVQMLFLQPVPVPERIFLGEVLFWVAFQRLPKADFNEDGQEIDDEDSAAGLAIEIPFPEISEEEAERIGIPPDPRYLAMLNEEVTLSPSHYDQLLRFPGLGPEDEARFREGRREAEIFEQKLAAWLVDIRLLAGTASRPAVARSRHLNRSISTSPSP